MAWYRDHVFPHLLDWAMRSPRICDERRQALREAHGEVLEIGFGTGLSLDAYPGRVGRLVATEPFAMLMRRVDQRISRSPIPVERVTSSAEQLPFDSGQFDCAVSTFTLCSVADPSRALAELRRVLKPNGMLLFVEHGRSEEPDVARRQDRWNAVQQRVAGGCNLNRPIEQLIVGAGFEIADATRSQLAWTPKVLASLYRGRAQLP